MLKFWKQKKNIKSLPCMNKANDVLSDSYDVNNNSVDNFSKETDLTTENIKKFIAQSSDIVFRDLYINGNTNLPITMIYIQGLVDTKLLNDNILKPLTQEMQLSNVKSIEETISKIEQGTVYHASQKTREHLIECVNDIMDGSVALVFDKVKKVITFDVKGYEKRNITEPTNENVIKGAKDVFIEDFRTNTATIRRKLKTHNLIIEEMIIGKQSASKIGIVYIKGLTNNHIVNELKMRLSKINIDGVMTTGIIEENIIDHKYTVFPQIVYTERPDKFCGNIMGGRVGVIIDGFPVTFIIPGTFNLFLQAPEDYSENFIITSIVRFLRFILVFATLFLPGFYISVTTFHHEMIPANLALAIQSAKEDIPFPTFIEVITMSIAFEILIEAGLRLPRNIGQAVSIVGAIVVGQAAVEAKLVSPVVVVIMSATAIASFTMPNQDFSNAIRVWRFIFVILSSIIGLYGLGLGAMVLLIQLGNMEVFGVPYLAPYVSNENKQMQDTLFRLPFSTMIKRPIYLKTTNKKRQEPKK